MDVQWDEKHIDYNFDVNKGKIFTEFFKGGQTNVCYNCLDKHVQEGRGNQLCFIWEGNDVGRDRTMTYKEALEEVCRVVCFSVMAAVLLMHKAFRSSKLQVTAQVMHCTALDTEDIS